MQHQRRQQWHELGALHCFDRETLASSLLRLLIRAPLDVSRPQKSAYTIVGQRGSDLEIVHGHCQFWHGHHIEWASGLDSGAADGSSSSGSGISRGQW